MKEIYKYDMDGSYLEPLILYPNSSGEYEIPENYTDINLPQPNWKPIFNGREWIESITEEELNEVSNPILEESNMELLQTKCIELEDALMELSSVSASQELHNIELEDAMMEMTEMSANQELRNSELESALLEMSELNAFIQASVEENEQAILELSQQVGGEN